ncbi:MAG: COX15/CtaA family protein [Flavobacteriales bacterium]|nr:COX15/CtaA family protein [Flavobacteriales bacterium]
MRWAGSWWQRLAGQPGREPLPSGDPLCAAFTIYSLVLWTIFDIHRGRRGYVSDGTSAGKWSRWLLAIVALQIIYGAFTAGLDAGLIHNTCPLMNGEFMPENVTAFGSLWKDFTDPKDGVSSSTATSPGW